MRERVCVRERGGMERVSRILNGRNEDEGGGKNASRPSIPKKAEHEMNIEDLESSNDLQIVPSLNHPNNIKIIIVIIIPPRPPTPPQSSTSSI